MSLKQHLKKDPNLKGMHFHHIVPKHMGGTDDLSNLILLTPKEHAKAHLELYNLYKKPQDIWAYNRLVGLIKNDMPRLTPPPTNLGRKWSNEVNKKKARYGNENAMSRPEIKEKHLKKMKELSGTGIFRSKHYYKKPTYIKGKQFDSVADAAKFYNVCRSTIRDWRKKEELLQK